MQFYLSKGNEKIGPLTRYQVTDLLASGEFGPKDLGWHEDLDRWMPLAEIPVIATIFEELAAAAKAPAKAPAKATPASAAGSPSPAALDQYGCKQARPFVRFFARSIDTSTFFILCWIILGGYEIPDPSKEESLEKLLEALRPMATINFTIIFAWNFIEALLLSTYGTTLGKYLLRVEVRTAEGKLLTYRQALIRSFFVWVAGSGLGFFPIREALRAIQFYLLVKTGFTSWDRTLNLRIVHRAIGEKRLAIAIATMIVLAIAINFVFKPAS